MGRCLCALALLCAANLLCPQVAAGGPDQAAGNGGNQAKNFTGVIRTGVDDALKVNSTGDGDDGLDNGPPPGYEEGENDVVVDLDEQGDPLATYQHCSIRDLASCPPGQKCIKPSNHIGDDDNGICMVDNGPGTESKFVPAFTTSYHFEIPTHDHLIYDDDDAETRDGKEHTLLIAGVQTVPRPWPNHKEMVIYVAVVAENQVDEINKSLSKATRFTAKRGDDREVEAVTGASKLAAGDVYIGFKWLLDDPKNLPLPEKLRRVLKQGKKFYIGRHVLLVDSAAVLRVEPSAKKGKKGTTGQKRAAAAEKASASSSPSSGQTPGSSTQNSGDSAAVQARTPTRAQVDAVARACALSLIKFEVGLAREKQVGKGQLTLRTTDSGGKLLDWVVVVPTISHLQITHEKRVKAEESKSVMRVVFAKGKDVARRARHGFVLVIHGWRERRNFVYWHYTHLYLLAGKGEIGLDKAITVPKYELRLEEGWREYKTVDTQADQWYQYYRVHFTLQDSDDVLLFNVYSDGSEECLALVNLQQLQVNSYNGKLTEYDALAIRANAQKKDIDEIIDNVLKHLQNHIGATEDEAAATPPEPYYLGNVYRGH